MAITAPIAATRTVCRRSNPAAPSARREAASGSSESSSILRTKRGATFAVGHNRDLLFLQLRDRLDLFAAGTDQQHHVMFQDRDGAGAGRDLGVGAQYRKIGVLAVELRERLGVVAVGHDLELQPRGIVLQHGGKLGGEARLGAVGLADRKDQCFGITQPGPAAPHRCGGQDQGQDRQTARSALRLLSDDRRTARRHFRRRRWGFSAHGSYPVGRRSAVKLAPQAARMNS